MRWVLIRPLNQSYYYDPEIQEPLGIEYLAIVLQNMGCNVLILDSALDSIDDIKLARRAISYKPDVIGFSITTDREIASVNLIYTECCKQINDKKIHWLAGGNFITSEIDNAINLLPTDFFFMKFEGEISIRKMVELWKLKNSISNTRITEGETVTNLDELPYPARPYNDYLLNYGWAFNIQGSRGCCSSCKYCASFGIRSKDIKVWRGRSPENIVNEIKSLNERFAAKTFNFVDEDFMGPLDNALIRVKSFYEEIKKSNLDITFGIQVRPNSLSEEAIEYLVNAGLKYVFMGIESDNPEDFKRWSRVFCDKTWHWVDLLQKKDVEVNAGTLLFHPECTFNSIHKFSEKLFKHQLFSYRTATNRLDAMPGSYYYKEYFLKHPNKLNQTGIQPLPFINTEIESFYSTIKNVLLPLGPPSLHAVCSLPPIQTYRRVSSTAELKYLQLKEIINICDNRVSHSFFLILEMYEKNTFSEIIANRIMQENRIISKNIVDNLVEKGFVRSPKILYKAINYEL